MQFDLPHIKHCNTSFAVVFKIFSYLHWTSFWQKCIKGCHWFYQLFLLFIALVSARLWQHNHLCVCLQIDTTLTSALSIDTVWMCSHAHIRTRSDTRKRTTAKILRIGQRLLTFIECSITVTSNDLKSVVAVISILEFIPHTLTMLSTTAVTQLDDDSQRRRLPTARIIGAKTTTTTPYTVHTSDRMIKLIVIVWHTQWHFHDKLNDVSFCWSFTHTSSTGSMLIGVHRNCHEPEFTCDRLDPGGNGIQLCIVTVSPSASLVENMIEFCSNTVHCPVSDPFPLTERKGTPLAATTNNIIITIFELKVNSKTNAYLTPWTLLTHERHIH